MPLPRVPERSPAARLRRGGGRNPEKVREGLTPLVHGSSTCANAVLTQTSQSNSATVGLLVRRLGKPQNMNEHVDWSAMSEEDFVALLRQLIDSPEADED
ncbi:hypothetical protein GCM10009602_55590 [Nocardiopsis tropica]